MRGRRLILRHCISNMRICLDNLLDEFSFFKHELHGLKSLASCYFLPRRIEDVKMHKGRRCDAHMKILLFSCLFVFLSVPLILRAFVAKKRIS